MKAVKENWSEIYNNQNLGKELGEQIIEMIKRDGYATTHDGVYHADDVFCMSLIQICLKDDVEFVRTRRETPYFTFDVGGGDFDHHHCDEFRDDENKQGIFASFGKLWCTLGRTLGLREEIWREIDEQFVQSIDHTDNTGVMNPINYAINATKHRGIEESDGLLIARAMANEILVELIESGLQKSEELNKFYEEYEEQGRDSKILHLSRHYIVDRGVYQSLGIDWITFPSCGEYTLQAVGKEILREEHRGLQNQGDIIFTHKGGWLAKGKTLEAVLGLL
jgi:uncharacterized UPF0160 family protein